MVKANDRLKIKDITYKLVKKLGEGTFGEVWSAHNINNPAEKVAIKIYKRVTPSVKKDLAREIIALEYISTKYSKLCKEHAACYKAHRFEDDRAVLVMDLITGQDLNDYRDSVPLSDRSKGLRNDVAITLINGIDDLHDTGITHQDIKSANIMWDSKAKRARFVDWGEACLKPYCSKRNKKCSQPCGFVGTIYAAPPEIINEMAKQSHLTGFTDIRDFKQAICHDIWSLGVVLLGWYTLKPGQKPWQTLNLLEWTLNDLKAHTRKIKDPYGKMITRLMLEPDCEKRLKNWETVLKWTYILDSIENEDSEIIDYMDIEDSEIIDYASLE